MNPCTELKTILSSDDPLLLLSQRVKRGAVYGKEGKTVLHLAAKHCKNLRMLTICISTLKINSATKTKKSKSTALHYAALSGNFEFVKFFIDLGRLDINLPRKDGSTPLMLAVKYNHVEVVDYLIDMKAQTQTKDKKSWNNAHWAAKNGNYKLFWHLVQLGVPVNSLTEDMENCLHLAATSGSIELVSSLIPYFHPLCVGRRGTVLHYAKGNWALVEWLLQNTV